MSEPIAGADVDVVVVGAGIGGLSTAVWLAARGCRVRVIEKSADVGGKMRTIEVAGRSIDAGPTVLTMRWVFEQLFAAAGARLEDFVRLAPLSVLARHAWPDGSRLDLFSDAERSAAAIESFAGRREAEGFRKFCQHARRIYEIVERPFIQAESSSMLGSLMRAGLRGTVAMLRVDWHRTLWQSLGHFFRDPRLRQLFGRYATYYGSSPFHAPGTLGLIAHVEQAGVWTVDGGMIELARGLRRLAELRGVEFQLGAAVEEVVCERARAVGVRLAGGARVSARAVVLNADPHAVVEGRFGGALRDALTLPPRETRSLSALTWSMLATTRGLPLAYHNVCFSSDYAREFEDLFGEGRVPGEPTVYVCAQDRGPGRPDDPGLERLFVLINAPAAGERRPLSAPEVDACLTRTLDQMQRCGLEVHGRPETTVVTTPTAFARRFPATEGALYGPATHGAMAPFSRPNPATKMPGLYLVGGGVHPGAGVPMVALGGRAAAGRLLTDQPSIARSTKVATAGGISMGSATTTASP